MGFFVFSYKKSLEHADIDNVPGQDLIICSVPEEIEIEIEPVLIESFKPAVQIEVFKPGLKSSAFFEYRFYNISDPEIASRQDPFNDRCLRVMSVVCDAFGFD